MSELFSAYARPQRNVGQRLAHAAPVLAALFVILPMMNALSSVDPRVVIVGGGLVWGLTVVSTFVFPNRVTLGFAVLGALLVGMGALGIVYPSGCPRAHPSSLLASLRETLTGKPEKFRNFSLACAY